MNMLRLVVLLLCCLSFVPVQAADYRVGDRLPAAKAKSGAYREIQWDDLMPKGWDPMAAFKGLDLSRMSDSDPRAIEALASARAEWDKAPVEPAMNGQRIRLAGFVIPLERKGDLIHEFLLVPFFGACVHVPPPPANQVVHVVASKPVKGMRTMDTFWVKGTLRVQGGDSGMGVYGYRITADGVDPYEIRKGKK
jgi:uncharacterized protein